jgi:hypothetical protein
MPPACLRYDRRPFQEAALPAMDADPRSPALPIRRKLEMIDRAMNTVIDGDSAPAWVLKDDSGRPENHFMRELWGIAVKRCNAVVLANLNGPG